MSKSQIYIEANWAMSRVHLLRKGQALMNALFVSERDLYDKITGTEADCFYSNENIPAFDKAVDDYYSEK